MEMLPWDVWGAISALHEPLNQEQLAFFDTLATLTRTPDIAFAELQRWYETDDRIRVPPTVFNALLNRPESL